MTDHIRCALAWLRALAGRTVPPRPGADPSPGTRATPPVTSAPRLPRTPRLPRHAAPRSAPYVDGGASPLVRPYLVAYEQQERRTALSLALDGIDVGPWVIHGVTVGGAV